MLNLFIVLPMSSGAGVTALAALGLGIAAVLFAIVSSRISFGSQFKGNKMAEAGREPFNVFGPVRKIRSFRTKIPGKAGD